MPPGKYSETKTIAGTTSKAKLLNATLHDEVDVVYCELLVAVAGVRVVVDRSGWVEEASDREASAMVKLVVVDVISAPEVVDTPDVVPGVSSHTQQHLYWPSTGGSSRASPPVVVSKQAPMAAVAVLSTIPFSCNSHSRSSPATYSYSKAPHLDASASHFSRQALAERTCVLMAYPSLFFGRQSWPTASYLRVTGQRSASDAQSWLPIDIPQTSE